jgi:hypothetical protein
MKAVIEITGAPRTPVGAFNEAFANVAARVSAGIPAGTPRTSGEVRFRAAVMGEADIKRI